MGKLYVALAREREGLGLRLVDEFVALLPREAGRLHTEHIVANVRAGRFDGREGFVVDEIDGDRDDPTATVWRSKLLGREWADRVAAMERAGVVTRGRDRAIARWLTAQPAKTMIDVGCGVGSMTVALKEAFPDAAVVAADSDPAMRAATRRQLACYNLLDRVEVSSTDVEHLAGLTSPGDLVWAFAGRAPSTRSAGCARALYAAVAHGGRLALAKGGLSARCLPWEVRLDAAQDTWFGSMRSELEGNVRVSHDWPSMLRRAGFDDVSSRTFLVDIPPPLDATGQRWIIDRLAWRWITWRDPA